MGRIAHVHDLQAAVAVGDVGRAADHLHSLGCIRGIVAAEQRRAGGVAHVQDQQTGVAVGHVGRGVGDEDVVSIPGCVIAPHVAGVRRIRHVHHPQPAIVGLEIEGGDVGVRADHGQALGGALSVETAHQAEHGGHGDVHDAQAVTVDQVGSGILHGDVGDLVADQRQAADLVGLALVGDVVHGEAAALAQVDGVASGWGHGNGGQPAAEVAHRLEGYAVLKMGVRCWGGFTSAQERRSDECGQGQAQHSYHPNMLSNGLGGHGAPPWQMADS